MNNELIYDFDHPFVYATDADTKRERKCAGIKFRHARGSEADTVFELLGALKPLADGGPIPKGIASNVIAFVGQFAVVVGHEKYPMQDAAEFIDSRDILPLSGFIVENFT